MKRPRTLAYQKELHEGLIFLHERDSEPVEGLAVYEKDKKYFVRYYKFSKGKERIKQLGKFDRKFVPMAPIDYQNIQINMRNALEKESKKGNQGERKRKIVTFLENMCWEVPKLSLSK